MVRQWDADGGDSRFRFYYDLAPGSLGSISAYKDKSNREEVQFVDVAVVR